MRVSKTPKFMRLSPILLIRRVLAHALCAAALGASLSAHALSADDALLLVNGDGDERIATLQRLAVDGDPSAHTLIRALSQERVRTVADRVLMVQDDGLLIDAVSAEVLPADTPAEDAMVNNRLRGAMELALAGMDVVGAAPERQLEAARILQRSAFDEPDVAQLPLLAKALAQPRLSAESLQILTLAQAAVMLASDDAAQRLQAAQTLGQAKRAIVRPLLMQRMAAEPDPKVRQALKTSLAAVDRALLLSSLLAQLFTGVSLGSILLLAALGLAITYGLMGVINMAHGELIMIGAYATWLVQLAFRQWCHSISIITCWWPCLPRLPAPRWWG
jgi:urea transport system permease protein